MRGNENLVYQSDNVVLWTSVSPRCVDLLNHLLNSKRFHLWPASTFTYLADGGALKLPLATSSSPYKKPHWMPVTLHGAPRPGHRKVSGRAIKARQ